MAELRPVLNAVQRYLSRLPAAAKFSDAVSEVVDRPDVLAKPGAKEPLHTFLHNDWEARATRTGQDLARAVSARLADLPLSAPYGNDPAAGRGFAENAMMCILFGPAPLASGQAVMGGVFAVGPSVDYVDHHHAPEELYLPISGRAEFWTEPTGWRAAGPDTVLIHPPWQVHALRTVQDPVLILWTWIASPDEMVFPTLMPSFGGLPFEYSPR